MSWLSDLIGSGAGEIINSVGNTVDRFVTTDEDRQKAELAKQEIALKFKQLEMDADRRLYEDRESARSMQSKTKSKIPGALTIIFTLAYFSITVFMLYFLLGKLDTDLSQFMTVFISSIFGAFNAIMVQIISFYFGSSQSGEDTGRAVADTFSQANRSRQGEDR